MARDFIYAFKKTAGYVSAEFENPPFDIDGRHSWQEEVELEFRARLWLETTDLAKASRKLWLSDVMRGEGLLSTAQQLWDEVGVTRIESAVVHGIDIGNPFLWDGLLDAFLIGNEYYNWDSLDFVNGKPYIYDEKGEPVNA